MQQQELSKAIKASKKIHGWLSKEAALLFSWLDDIQKENMISGDIFEIGCHHGKSALILGAIASENKETLVVCDLFGEQSDNISKSGSGDLDIFKRNMAPIYASGVDIDIHQVNSNTLSAAEIGRNYRIFHIDGGHNCDEALSDLELAVKCTTEQGVIVVDDPFRPEWPGVTEAIIRFLDAHTQYRAIIVGFNKLVLTRKEHSNIYLKETRESSKCKYKGLAYPWHTKELPFNGQSLQIFYIPTYLPRSLMGRFIRLIRQSIGQVIHRFKGSWARSDRQ